MAPEKRDPGADAWSPGSRALVVLLLAPAAGLFVFVLIGSLLTLITVSLETYSAGRIGKLGDVSWTVSNYAELLLSRSYLMYLIETLRIAFIGSVISLMLAYPLALVATRAPTQLLRRSFVFILTGSFFLNAISRVYSWVVILGEGGVFPSIMEAARGRPVHVLNTETGVVVGLIHFLVPLAALSLIASLSNIDPAVLDSAASLGANEVQSFFRVTLPLSIPGLISAFSLSFSLGVSAFVVPLLLGGGIVVMMANLIYNRFSEIANYPSGAAFSVVLFGISFAIVSAVEYLIVSRVKWLRHDE